MNKVFEVIIVGLGAMGSAALYQLSKRGKNVLGIDQFSPPHTFGSSHGDTRITRQAVGEGEQYVPLLLRSNEIWREIEKETGEKLLEITGGLIISSKGKAAINHVPEFFEKTIKAAKKYNIRHDLLNAIEIRNRFPQFNIQEDEEGYYEYDAGFLRPEKCIEAQINLAEHYGATTHKNEKVESFSEEKGIVQVKTNFKNYKAKKIIITAGPWLPTMIEETYAKYFKIIRQVLFWFDAKKTIKPFEPKNFPVFVWELQKNKQVIYGFPAIGGKNEGVKIASEHYETTTTADAVDRTVSQKEIKSMYENFIQPYFPGLSNHCVKAAVCLYTVTPDAHFVIDQHPKYPSVILASPCSGHGFKHSAAIGEILAQLAINEESKMDISGFKINRTGIA
jgi:sarcosine oxidase